MVKVCVELSDLVILGGIASFGLLVFDHSNNDGKVLAQIKHFYNEVKQSVFNGDEQRKFVENEATSKAESLNDGKSADDQKQGEAAAKDGEKRRLQTNRSNKFMFVCKNELSF